METALLEWHRRDRHNHISGCRTRPSAMLQNLGHQAESCEEISFDEKAHPASAACHATSAPDIRTKTHAVSTELAEFISKKDANSRFVAADFETACSQRPRRSRAEIVSSKSTKSKNITKSILFNGISSPNEGQLYTGSWSSKSSYGVMVLPWEKACGKIPLVKDTILVKEKIPCCYMVDEEAKNIKGWAPGYENGGDLEQERLFPVVYFAREKSFGWMPATKISPFNFEKRPKNVRYFNKARDEYARLLGYAGYLDMKDKIGIPPPDPGQPGVHCKDDGVGAGRAQEIQPEIHGSCSPSATAAAALAFMATLQASGR